jgi:exodeoxyribonuclease V alpha subunit
MAVPVPAQEDAHTAWVQGVLRAFDRFRLLCAVREGPGRAGLNRAVETALRGAGLLQGRGEWYAGRPVMVTRNDAGWACSTATSAWCCQAPGGGLRAYFADGRSCARWVWPGWRMWRPPCHDGAQSQGSEFGHTALVLPPGRRCLAQPELVYTGITRARDAFTLVAAQPAVLEQALRQRTQRSSGLPARLQA